MNRFCHGLPEYCRVKGKTMSAKRSVPAIDLAVERMPRCDAHLHPDAIRAFERCPIGDYAAQCSTGSSVSKRSRTVLSGWHSYAGHTVRDLIDDEETFHKLQLSFQERLLGIAAEYELELTRADSRRIPVSVAATPITDADG